jgi:molecular chaperone DnaK (HSP70)
LTPDGFRLIILAACDLDATEKILLNFEIDPSQRSDAKSPVRRRRELTALAQQKEEALMTKPIQFDLDTMDPLSAPMTDRTRGQEVEARNNAELMAYQVEWQIRDLGDNIAVNEKARAEQLISEIRQLINGESTDIARLRQLSSDLQQVGYGLSSAACSQSTAAGAQSGGATSTQQGGDDDVIDSDFKKT